MANEMLTIVIPIRKHPFLNEFIERNKGILEKYPVIVIDSFGGEALEAYADTYIKKPIHLWSARKLGYSLVKTKYTMNLDSDVIVPTGFIEESIKILESNEKIGVVTTFLQDTNREGIAHRGVLNFGISIWRTDLLLKLYDYDNMELRRKGRFINYCECLYMWERVIESNFGIEVFNERAVHLKGDRNECKERN